MEVEMDVVGVHNHNHHHHQQELSSQTLESMLQVCTKPQEDKKPRPPEESLKCPRCDSGNTKFCYYNNYSLTQPRYFCKSCRRYWTKGGTLRNVPVGGGCRKNKRSSASSATSSATSSCSAPSKIRGHQDLDNLIQQHPLNFFTTPNCSNNIPLIAGLPHLSYNSTSTNLSLAFAKLQNQPNGPMSYDHFDQNDHHLGTNNVDHLGFLDAIMGDFLGTTTNNPNRFHHNLLPNGGNFGNGDMGSVGNLMGMNQDQQMLNPMLQDHQEQEQELITCGAATTAVSVTPVKQEACNMMRSSELWGFSGNMVHEVESGRSMIGGWNGIGSTNWHGLINSPLM